MPDVLQIKRGWSLNVVDFVKWANTFEVNKFRGQGY